MGTIKLHNVIKKPKELVQTALLEGLNVHKDLGNITFYKYSTTNHLHYVELNPSVWPKDIINPFISIQLKPANDSEIHTELESTLNFTYTTKLSLKRFFRNITIRQLIKYEALNRLHQFKYRIEKWL